MRQIRRDEIKAALQASRSAFMATAFFSLVLNVLMLAGPLYMMQVYDRVMASRSIPTLVALTVIIVVLYALSGGLELVRSRVLTRIGLAFDDKMSERVFDASARLGLVKGRTQMQPLRDFDSMRQFLASPGPAAFFDLPWVPIYLALLFIFHWMLGAFALACALALFGIALATEWVTHAGVAQSTQASRKSSELAEAGHNNAEVLAAMGMLGNYRARWVASNREALMIQSTSSDTIANLTSLSKTLRMLMQSIILGLGAALAIHGDVSAGAIIAGSILMGRALAPVEQVIGHWRSFVRARQAHASLNELLNALPPTTDKVELPAPKGQIDVRGVRLAPPGSQRITVQNASFSVGPGQVLAVAGPSASGKSTLARALVGVWPVLGGEIRLDGAKLDQWDQQRLGTFIGYVPQDVELFAGSVRENIARFEPDADDADIIAAAKLARAHNLILDLPQGYDTELGSFGSHLSAGQKQRIALARALYGNPVLLVFDEPNSNLDSDGDAALIDAIGEMKQQNRTVIIVTHRSSAIARADLLLLMENGQVRDFGPREDVIRKLNQGSGAAQGPTGMPQGAPGMPHSGARPQAQPAPQARPAGVQPQIAAMQTRPTAQPTLPSAAQQQPPRPAAATQPPVGAPPPLPMPTRAPSPPPLPASNSTHSNTSSPDIRQQSAAAPAATLRAPVIASGGSGPATALPNVKS
jgi:PrtD family type I secretion system ABC transporter